MSGPKSGNYRVVSQAELRRRQIAAARDRHSRELASVQEFQAALSAAEATYGDLAIAVPRANVSQAREAEDWERASNRLAAGLDAAKRQLEENVRTARMRMLSADGSRVSTVLTEAPQSPRPTKTAATRSEASDGKLTDVLARLPRVPGPTSPPVATRWPAVSSRLPASPRSKGSSTGYGG